MWRRGKTVAVDSSVPSSSYETVVVRSKIKQKADRPAQTLCHLRRLCRQGEILQRFLSQAVVDGHGVTDTPASLFSCLRYGEHIHRAKRLFIVPQLSYIFFDSSKLKSAFSPPPSLADTRRMSHRTVRSSPMGPPLLTRNTDDEGVTVVWMWGRWDARRGARRPTQHNGRALAVHGLGTCPRAPVCAVPLSSHDSNPRRQSNVFEPPHVVLAGGAPLLRRTIVAVRDNGRPLRSNERCGVSAAAAAA